MLQETINQSNFILANAKLDYAIALKSYRKMTKDAQLPSEYESILLRIKELKRQMKVLKEAVSDLNREREQILMDSDDMQEAENFLSDEQEQFERIKLSEINKVALEVAKNDLQATVSYGKQLSLNF